MVTLVISAVLTCLGLLLEIGGALFLAFGIFRSEEKIRELSDLPIKPHEIHFQSVADPTPAIHKSEIGKFKNLLIHNYLNERKLGRLGFVILAFGLLLQLFGYLLMVIPQLSRV